MRIRVVIKASSHDQPGGHVVHPVTFGVPFREGSCPEGTQWSLTSPGRAPKFVQGRILERWSDGSVRWLLVDTQLSHEEAASAEWTLEALPAVMPPAAVTCTTLGTGRLRVETGVASMVLGAGRTLPFESMQTPLGDVIASSSLVVTGAGAGDHEAVLNSVQVEEHGPLRSVVRADGDIHLDGRTLAVIVRVHFYAGLPGVRLLITLRNHNPAEHPGGFWDLGDRGSILIKAAALKFGISGAPSALASTEPSAGISSQPMPIEIHQESSGGTNWRGSNHLNRNRTVPFRFQGYQMTSGDRVVSTGLRATPIVAAGRIGLAVPKFWQNFPQTLAATSNELVWHLLPGQCSDLHELQGGEQKTYEAWLSFAADTAGAAEALVGSRLVAAADPAWISGTGALDYFAPLLPAHARAVDAAIEGADSFEAKREVIDEYGWRHFGELYGDHESVRQTDPPIVSHYNNQYDAASGLIHQFLRTSDVRWWTLADDLIRHVIDIDVYHTTGDKYAYNGGMFWHTYHYGDADLATHRTYPAASRGRTHGGGPSAGHNYTSGLLLHYFLTGEEPSRETVIGLGRYVINLDDGRQSIFRWLDRGETGYATLSAPGYFGPGRGAANSLNALMDAERLTNDPRLGQKAEQIVRRAVHPAQAIDQLRLHDTEQRWFYTMFLQSLGKYLRHKSSRAERDEAYDYARASLLHFARWMAEHERPYLDHPERLEFPTETWPAQDIRKSDVFYYAALHAHGAERERFVERGRFFHEYSISTLSQSATRTLLRPMVILMTSGFMTGWFTLNADASEPYGSSARDHGAPVLFVPQKTRALRRAVQLAVALGVGMTAFVAWWFIRGS